MSQLERLLAPYVEAVEAEMRRWVPPAEGPHRMLYGMVRYHLGWADEHFRPCAATRGKRVRSALCLMAGEAVGGDVACVVPAAAAVELLHEFSLIHDDIEDGDRERRGRPTLWALWGLPQAINAGDALFALAFLALNGLLERGVPPARAAETQRRFARTVIRLCEGQHLDLDFERRDDIAPEDYLLMVEGKTAALIALAAELGGLVAGATADLVEALARFGRALGLAFQMQDDLLGLWGDPERTGKPAGNDLRRRKKSLPVLLARRISDQAAEALDALFKADPIPDEMVTRTLQLMERVGARREAEARVRESYRAAMQALDELEAALPAERIAPLRHLTEELMGREY